MKANPIDPDQMEQSAPARSALFSWIKSNFGIIPI